MVGTGVVGDRVRFPCFWADRIERGFRKIINCGIDYWSPPVLLCQGLVVDDGGEFAGGMFAGAGFHAVGGGTTLTAYLPLVDVVSGGLRGCLFPGCGIVACGCGFLCCGLASPWSKR